jgi:hypothetical protein
MTEEEGVPLANEIETVYYLENPEKNLIKLATGYQLKYDDIIKDVFGVACLKDLPMMIKYNKSFQDSICATHGVKENEITLEMVVHVATRTELLQFRKQMVEESSVNEDSEQAELSCPFDSTIRLKEGIFSWDQQNFTYNIVNA